MAINLMALTPHQVSKDLSGYITYLYGQPKVGKTTLVSQFPGVLLLACEKGYGAIPGIIVQDVTSWTDMRQIVRTTMMVLLTMCFMAHPAQAQDAKKAIREHYAAVKEQLKMKLNLLFIFMF